MCVIMVKPQGNKLPSLETFEKCAKTNPHGIGYMFTYNEMVYIRKGFDDVKSLIEDLKNIKSELNIPIFAKLPMVFHFRISTQGGVSKELCHPYPVCENYDDMRKLNFTCKIGMAHNGIISLTSERRYYYENYDIETGTWKPSEVNYNDTMTFIKDYASLVINNDLYFSQNKAKVKLLENIVKSGNKLAFLNKHGFIKMIGDFTLVDGCYYSNTLWQNETTSKKCDKPTFTPKKAKKFFKTFYPKNRYWYSNH